MNKVAVTFVIVVIVLAVIIQLDFSHEQTISNNTTVVTAQNNIYDKYYIDYIFFDNIQYI